MNRRTAMTVMAGVVIGPVVAPRMAAGASDAASEAVPPVLAKACLAEITRAEVTYRTLVSASGSGPVMVAFAAVADYRRQYDVTAGAVHLRVFTTVEPGLLVLRHEVAGDRAAIQTLAEELTGQRIEHAIEGADRLAIVRRVIADNTPVLNLLNRRVRE